MSLTPEILLFALFAVTSVVSALGVVLIRDPVKGALSLIACFFSIACLFLLQKAELIAVLEVLVYAGAIMVLFVFVIMLVGNKEEAVVGGSFASRLALPVKVGGVAVIGWAFASLISRSNLLGSAELPPDFGSVRSIGMTFFDGFVLHFELTSVLLLVGIVGAVVVSKRVRKGVQK